MAVKALRKPPTREELDAQIRSQTMGHVFYHGPSCLRKMCIEYSVDGDIYHVKAIPPHPDPNEQLRLEKLFYYKRRIAAEQILTDEQMDILWKTGSLDFNIKQERKSGPPIDVVGMYETLLPLGSMTVKEVKPMREVNSLYSMI